MVHLWLRAEQRPFEKRCGLTPEGAATLLADGFRLTVEESAERIFPTAAYAAVGCQIAPAHSWPDAPADAIIFGLKELDEDGPDLPHRHIHFGHAYKGQASGPALLRRFQRAGGTLYDLEYLQDDSGRRVAAFGYWAGYAGAVLGLRAWVAQQNGTQLGAQHDYPDTAVLNAEVGPELAALPNSARNGLSAIIIGALGRVGRGAAAFLNAMDVPVTAWDIDETRHGGPFPEILDHTIFVNAILANPGCPRFIGPDDLTKQRALRVVADVACDPFSAYNPIAVYNRTTSFADPVIRLGDAAAPLDIMAVDNLPSMLPRESSEDFAAQLLPHLRALGAIDQGVWGRAKGIFAQHAAAL